MKSRRLKISVEFYEKIERDRDKQTRIIMRGRGREKYSLTVLGEDKYRMFFDVSTCICRSQSKEIMCVP